MIKVMEELQAALEAAIRKLFDTDVEAELTRPDEKFGDYASNAALQLAKQLGKNPREVADGLAGELKGQALLAEPPAVAGPGFLNFKLSDQALARAATAAAELNQPLKGQEILVEFGDANPFKEMHMAHLYQCVFGDAVARLLETNGANVKRLSYHGDVGRHVAMAIWGMQQDPERPIGGSYAAGARAFAEDEKAKTEIQTINEHVYKQDDPNINKLYEKGRRQSLDGFEKIYAQIGLKYDKNYFESQSTPVGMKLVNDNRNVFKESDGAIVYDGEKAGLHTRVFITSKGLPTYETKDLGLVELKHLDYPNANRSIIVTGKEQSEYFKVMLAALAQINPGLAKKTTHLSTGFLSLTTGKMSSRSGNVFTAKDLLQSVREAVEELYPKSELLNEISIGATKYAFLSHRLGQDIVIDVKAAASLEGNSGPYLQYAHARAKSILAKAGKTGGEITDLQAGERNLARKLSEYPEVIAKATAELMPHHICTYLYELAQAFNSFYEHNRVIGDPRETTRLSLVSSYSQILKRGLALLNITAPDKM